MIDLIGDVHGHADELEALLIKLGYSKKEKHYSHPDRTVLFVGDYIDRGPKIRETLEIVKAMVDNGSAIALMGNHEYNALCFHYKNKEGGHLREHSIKNIIQHYETLRQFQSTKDFQDGEKKYEEYLEWFKTLPLFHETETYRAVHACWDYKSIEVLKKHLKNDRLTEELIYKSVKEETELYDAIEITLKGKETTMPNDISFIDSYGSKRNEMRIKWWEDPAKMNYDEISVHPNEKLPATSVNLLTLKDKDYYKPDEKAVFFGHYWLEDKPSIYKDNICCLDYSVAKEGRLAAYSFDDEAVLETQKFTSVPWIDTRL